MSRAGSSLSVRMSDIAVDDIRPLFVHFCKRMSVEQWDLLDQGSSDDAVKVIVAELILKKKESQEALIEVSDDGLEEEVTSNKSWQPETSDKGSIQASGDGSVRSRASVTGSVQSELQLDLFSPELQLLDLFSPELQLLDLFSPELQLLDLFSPELRLLDLFSPELQLLNLFSPKL
ncbi:hypothetical protein F7725_000020 [Dissostichus mawsoni]|uniref:Uncharacterized protein n=1 Tax=Dissostichus mawsoni TaxID=36200 RepID=A0A7J5ZHG2_DISMA|nr:hypothetical protein F7725_000020 [Dissostichus mawsoni]